MFSKEEAKQLRQLFWTSFGKSFPKKWLLYNTKIKGLDFKFHFDTKAAFVSLDLEGNLETRIMNWIRIESLKSILLEDYLTHAVFEETCILDNGKEISRVYVQLPQKVSIHNKNTWQDVMQFFYDTMNKFEDFFYDFEDVLRQ